MLLFKLFAICSLVLLVVWLALGKTVRVPAFSFAGKTAKIPSPRYASPARKDVWGLSVIHLAYLTVTVGGCSLLYQLIGLTDWVAAIGFTPAQVGPFIASVMYAVAAVASVFLLLSLYFTVRRSAAWFTVACHSALILCVCRLIFDWMASMEDPEQGRLMMTQFLFVYLGVAAVYAVIFFVYTKMYKKAQEI